MMDQWLIIRTPGGVHCWNLGALDPELSVLAGRLLAEVPPTQDWVTDGSGYDVQLTYGQPHDKLLALATVHDVKELATVTLAQLDAYRTQVEQSLSTQRVAAVTDALASLSDAEQQQVLAAVPAAAGG